MHYLPITIFAGFGLIIGSFLNVLILRYNTGKGLGGRSECFSCGRNLTTRDLLPVVSFLLYGGRCRTCKSKISKQYVLVELATALLFVLTYVHNQYLLPGYAGSGELAMAGIAGATSFPWLFLIKSIIDCAIMSLFVFMAGYDIRHKIIPDGSVFLFAILALLGWWATVGFSWWHLAAGPLLALPFYLIWLLSGGRWMGLGDAKLALGFGWMLGLSAAGTAAIFGFWAGAVYALAIVLLRPDVRLKNKILLLICLALVLYAESTYGMIMISNAFMATVLIVMACMIVISRTQFLKRLTRWGYLPALRMKTEVPFAPFLIVGLLIVYVLGYNLFTFWIGLWPL